MKVVTDTSVVVAVIANEKQKESIVEATQQAKLIAPESLSWEVGNAFSAMFKQNRISLDQAIEMFGAFRNIPIQYVDIDMNQALEYAHKNDIYAYDAYMLACAQTHNAPLATLDTDLANTAKSIKVDILDI